MSTSIAPLIPLRSTHRRNIALLFFQSPRAELAQILRSLPPDKLSRSAESSSLPAPAAAPSRSHVPHSAARARSSAARPSAPTKNASSMPVAFPACGRTKNPSPTPHERRPPPQLPSIHFWYRQTKAHPLPDRVSPAANSFPASPTHSKSALHPYAETSRAHARTVPVPPPPGAYKPSPFLWIA